MQITSEGNVLKAVHLGATQWTLFLNKITKIVATDRTAEIYTESTERDHEVLAPAIIEGQTYSTVSDVVDALTALVDSEASLINDQSALNYVDVGGMRIQWGTKQISSDSTQTVILPAAFKDSNYSVTAGSTGGTSTGSGNVGRAYGIGLAKTATRFGIDRDNDIDGTLTVFWQAIGLKPD